MVFIEVCFRWQCDKEQILLSDSRVTAHLKFVLFPKKISLYFIYKLITYLCKQSLVVGNSRPGETLPAGVTFGIGAVAGLITVYATMPFEYVKFLNVFQS